MKTKYTPDPKRLGGPDHTLLRAKDVLTLIPVSNSTWWRWVKAGKAPRPIRIGGTSAPFWRLGDIRKFIQEAGA